MEVYEALRDTKEDRRPLSNLRRTVTSPAKGAAATRRQPGGHISEGECPAPGADLSSHLSGKRL